MPTLARPPKVAWHRWDGASDKKCCYDTGHIYQRNDLLGRVAVAVLRTWYLLKQALGMENALLSQLEESCYKHDDHQELG